MQGGRGGGTHNIYPAHRRVSFDSSLWWFAILQQDGRGAGIEYGLSSSGFVRHLLASIVACTRRNTLLTYLSVSLILFNNRTGAVADQKLGTFLFRNSR